MNPYSVTRSGYDGGAGVETRAIPADGTGGDVPTETTSNVRCEDGKAGPFACKDIDLESFLPIKNMTRGDGSEQLNDIWGWTDPDTAREYAIVGKTNGTSFVDVTDGLNPIYLGDLPSYQRAGDEPVETIFNVWRDIKVYRDHAYIVSEEPSHGVQVFDLKRLRGVTEPQTFDEEPGSHYSFVADGPGSLLFPPDPNRTPLVTLDNAHNIAINEESGYAYAIGTSTCGSGGAHMLKLGDPDQNPKPEFAGCIADDSYTHDTQCVNYDGPDTEFAGDEICFSSNEDSLTVHKVAEADGERVMPPEQLSKSPYAGSEYTHQGWLSEDGTRFIVGDELDEQAVGGKTKTLIFNVEQLNAPDPNPVVYEGRTESIDHNMYTKGNEIFQANYRSGLEVLDSTNVADGELTSKAFFDIYPDGDEAEFNGAWSNYPYYESGNVVVSGIEQGLFVVRPHSAGPRSTGGTGEDSSGGGSSQGGPTSGSGESRAGAASCFTAATQARQKRLGRAGLGNRRSNVRRTFGAEGKYRRFLDRYCLADDSTIRVGYPSGKQMRRLVARERRRLRGKASLVLTSSRRSAVRGVNVGDSVRELRDRTGNRRGVRVGKNVWFVRRGARAGHVFKVQDGVVREVGLADRKQTATNARVKRFFTSGR